jgi:ornithine carbamoyltransferase
VKHFIDIDNFNNKDLRLILTKAKKLKKDKDKNILLLRNKSLGLLFKKKSIRTRLSFNIGMQKLGGNVIELEADKIGLGSRESDEDILKTMSQYLDVLMIRNDDHEQLINLSSKNILPIINGLSNNSHPCQILSDIFTIEEKLGLINKRKIVWIGDYNNVLISLIQAAEVLKFKLNILIPPPLIKKHKKFFRDKKLKFSNFYDDFDLALYEADCIMTDVWFSMGENPSNYKKKLLSKFQVNQNIMKKAKKNAIFMHCLPAYRNQEVTNEVIDGSQSVVWQQAQNRMYVQQSILNYLLKNV